MVKLFDNLKQLKHDMEFKGWTIDSFYFYYKKQNYIVLVKLFDSDEKRPEYALVKLEFLKENDFTDSLLVSANSVKLFIDAKTLREYFNIEYVENLGDILSQFNQRLAEVIPTEVLDNKTEAQEIAMLTSLNKSDPEDPRKIYCYAVKRNPRKSDGTLGRRSPYNDNKTRIRRKTLYARLGNDTNLSFYYSMNIDEENSDEIIIANWIKNQNK
ncbi:DUF6037 family protein [Clostridium botulinum]|uniref:DUF6037 family protein n=1 Tax=Clostridium botulinum TaxID=1491 RepID=UPI003DA3152D